MNNPLARIRAHFRDAVGAARQAGRDARDKQVAELGRRAVDDQMPGWANRWLDHDSHEPGAAAVPSDGRVEPGSSDKYEAVVNRFVIAQAGREFDAAAARAAENGDPQAREHLAREVQRTARQLVELEGGIVGGSGVVDIVQARQAAAEQRRSLTEPTPPGAGVGALAAERARTALQLAELEAVEDTTGSLREPDEEIEP
ncbi:hypothetical protein [Pseudonocardia sp. KRD291]|uniref:hypothetical protein n=1 Tax=Pseudonocardia sp. KRD291 TaxID=2792007 RepID=UPI001C4A6CC1|nr:hypothetical protein [Pseudonocardia sp. KRD291]MBW0102947.1 hypothetical protein [Pseudonocardia sp. KRD291]